MENKIRLKELIAPHFWNTFKSKEPHQIDYGGRGSTKTSKNSLKIVYHCMVENKCSVVVLRKVQHTLRKSVYSEVKRALSRFNLIEGVDYKAMVSPMQIKLFNGNVIYFAGADDYNKIKGMVDEKNPIKIVWFEELTEFDNEEELDQIIATFSRGNNDWFISLYSYNPPKNKFDWVNEWSIKKKSEDCQVTESDYRTVPSEWLGEMFIQEAERLLKYDPKRYNWIYLGEVTGIEGLIYNFEQINILTKEEMFEKKLKVIYLDFSVDGGHQVSATICQCFGYLTNGSWCLLDTYYYSPNEKAVKKAPSELAKDISDFERSMIVKHKANIDKETIDSAEGALRNQLFRDYGKRFNPVNKGKNKQELIDYCQDFLSHGKFFVLDEPNNSIFLKEMKEYMYKEGSVEKGKPEADKTEKEFKGSDVYFNTHSKDYAYYYADHTCDGFQYWVKDNLQKLKLKY